jgi:dTMP kinase
VGTVLQVRKRSSFAPVDPSDPDAPTDRLPNLGRDEAPSTVVRLFGSPGFFRLWLAQVVSATGDWIGFLAVVAIAGRVGGGSGAAAVSLVMTARMVPGFFLAPLAGVLVDRCDRKKVMVCADLARAAVLLSLPFIDTLWALVIASLLLEVATLLWSPAKEASVPNLVPSGHLTTANSLSLAAAYGTFPIASLLFALLQKAGDSLESVSVLSFARFGEAGSTAIYFDVLTFVASALFISTLVLPPARRSRRSRRDEDIDVDFGATFRELREGWQFMFTTPIVRAVMLALATGLVGGGMIVPLGDVFSREVLGGGPAGFGVLLSAMGFGMAVGVIVLSAVQRRLPKTTVFTGSALGAGISLFAAASVSSFTPALLFVGSLGLCAGSIYVLGFTILHENVLDDLRGRIFASLYTLVRFCLLLSFALGPLLADALDSVRLTLWLAAATIVAAGFVSLLSLRGAPRHP